MKTRLLAVNLTLILLWLVSCSSAKEENTILFDELEPDEFHGFLSSAEVQLIPLATDETVIGDFNMFRKADNEYFVFSGQEGKVHRFSDSGTFLNTIGQIGDGPTEYRNPSGFVVSGDSLVILSQGKGSSLSFYSKTGEFIKSIFFKESTYPSFELADFGYVFSTGSNTVFGNKHNLHSRNFKGELISKFYPIIDRAMFSIGTNNFGRNENESLYFEPFNNQVYKIEKDSLIPTYKFDFGNLNLKENAFESEDPYENFQKIMNNGTAFILAYVESENYAYFNIMLQKNPDKPKAFHLLLNKKTGASRLIKSMEETAPAFQFIAGDRLLFLFHAGDILNLAKENPALFGKRQPVIDGVKQDDNPIIVITKIEF
ncbi:6-bladed beta-propeller [Roseivirga sp.]|uniref:6-bladed beta-propeller n=1 Tax=Roseivirga sp. TaxID=1964215 RepID=UPI002B26A634|nr:6-bladed beta-propeller [Roseivirga sp.]